MKQRYTIEVNGESYGVEVDESGADTYRVVVDGEKFAVHFAQGDISRTADSTPQIVAQPARADALSEQGARSVFKTEIRAPMPGVVLSVAVQPGEKVQVAQQLVVLEAMKMKNPIRSPGDGVVAEVVVQAGQSVGYNDLLLRFEEV